MSMFVKFCVPFKNTKPAGRLWAGGGCADRAKGPRGMTSRKGSTDDTRDDGTGFEF